MHMLQYLSTCMYILQYLCTCMYLYVHVAIPKCMYVHALILMFMYVDRCLCLHVCILMYMYVYIYVCIRNNDAIFARKNLWNRTPIYTYMRMYIKAMVTCLLIPDLWHRIRIYIYIYIYICARTWSMKSMSSFWIVASALSWALGAGSFVSCSDINEESACVWCVMYMDVYI
jgi:hypothetical protein